MLKHTEQAALNFAIYNGPPANCPHMLPALANWICYLALPAWDPVRRKLTEPLPPHEELGLIHLTGMRGPICVPTTTGGQITAHLTYNGIRALGAAAV